MLKLKNLYIKKLTIAEAMRKTYTATLYDYRKATHSTKVRKICKQF